MSNVKSLLEQKAKKKQEATEAPIQAQAVEVEGEVPDTVPKVGDIVLVSWGNPVLIGSPIVTIPCIVTHVLATGRLNGQMFFDPTSEGVDPASGRPVSLPPVAPIANVPYSKTPRALTWRSREDA